LCRMFDQLVEPVLCYGCQVWGPDIFSAHLDFEHILQRDKNPVEAVHIDFLRLIGGLPTSSPLWILFLEFGRVPIHFHWISLCTRFWHKAVHTTDDSVNVLLRLAMMDNIKLALDNSQQCWVSKFLRSLVMIGFISDTDLMACTTVSQVTDLPINEACVTQCLQGFWKSQALGDTCNPRYVANNVPITYSRYQSWVYTVAPPPHVTAFLPTNMKHMLIRLRSTGFPLHAYSNLHRREKIPRSQRLCKACVSKGLNCVEDDLHFLIECPSYSHIRLKHATIFHDEATPASIYNFPNQAHLGKALKSMLLQRRLA
jgi:hypothetical protein